MKHHWREVLGGSAGRGERLSHSLHFLVMTAPGLRSVAQSGSLACWRPLSTAAADDEVALRGGGGGEQKNKINIGERFSETPQ